MLHLHPPLAGQLLQRLEAEVSQACVAPPGDVVALRQETHRLCNGGVEHITPVVTAWDLG
jgi:hypothetical protein